MLIWDFLKRDLTNEQLVDFKASEYEEKREKVYVFLRLPLILEKFMFFGFLQCADTFLYICTFLPLRIIFALLSALLNPFSILFK
jgi:hypothetical protein